MPVNVLGHIGGCLGEPQVLQGSGSQKAVGSIPWKWGEPPHCPLKVTTDWGGDLPRNSWLLWAPGMSMQGLCLGRGVETSRCRLWASG